MNPPRKKKGQAEGVPRRFDGELMDVETTASFLGTSDKTVWSRVRRREIPFRKLGGRVLFSRSQLFKWIEALGGCDVKEAVENIERRV